MGYPGVSRIRPDPVKFNAFVADKPRVWIAALGAALGGRRGEIYWDLAPGGKRVAVVTPEGAAQALHPEHATAQ